MQLGIIIAIIIIALGLYWFRNRAKTYDKAPTDFVLVDSSTESMEYLPTVEKNWLHETELKYANKEWKSYPNEHTDQSAKLCNEVYKSWKGEISHSEFLNKLTKEQRLYFALINFEAQTNNGGVYQFLFNYPELSIIALDAMKKVGLGKLAEDYKTVLNEFFGKFDTIQELNKRFNSDNNKWDKRWDSFVEGYKKLPSADKIEEYFYDAHYKREYQSKIVQFVKNNAKGLMKTK